MYFCSLTTNNVQGTEGDVVEAVERTLPCLLLQLLHQDVGLFVHHFQEVGQNREVEGGSQHLSPRAPLSTGADQKKNGKCVSCGTCTHLDWWFRQLRSVITRLFQFLLFTAVPNIWKESAIVLGTKLDKNPGEKGMNNFQFMSLLAKSMEGNTSPLS